MSTSPAIYSLTTLYANITGSWYTVNGVTDISGPNLTSAEIEVTHLDSTAIEYKGAALTDAGTLDFSLQFNPTNTVHKYLLDSAATSSLTPSTFGLVFSDSTTYTFSGSVLDFGIKASDPKAGVLTADVKVRLTDAINFAGSVA